MTVNIENIVDAFNDLESNKRSREEIANFAADAIAADDAGLLKMEPTSEAPKIWKAITYLSGVDIKVTADVYLHGTADFVDFRNQIGIPR